MNTKKICIFCSSSEDLPKIYYQTVEELGKMLAYNNYEIIHGAGIIGLMGALIRGAAKYDAKITGVVPEKLNKKNIVSDSLQTLVVTADMKDRKEYMRQNSDAFIAAAGGFGTLEELMEIITLKQLKYHNKPIVILNTNGFYNTLFQHFDKLYQENFTNNDYKNLYHIASSPQEAIDYIQNYTPQNIFDKYLKE